MVVWNHQYRRGGSDDRVRGGARYQCCLLALFYRGLVGGGHDGSTDFQRSDHPWECLAGHWGVLGGVVYANFMKKLAFSPLFFTACLDWPNDCGGCGVAKCF